jgi:putative hemolysin
MNHPVSIVLTLFLLLLLILCVGFFSSSETAFLSIPKLKIRQMLKNNEYGARRIAKLRSDMDSLLTVVLIGINFISTFASSIATALAIEIAGQNGVGIATIVVTFFVTVLGEIVPKTIATVDPVKIARRNASALVILQKILFPLVWFFTGISQTLAGTVQKFWKSDDPVVTEDELKTLIDVGTREGTLEKSEKTMLYKIFEFTDLHVYDIMKHRSLIKSVPVGATRNELTALFLSAGYSRLPVYNGSPETIVGILHYKSVLFASSGEVEKSDFVRKNMRPVLFIPESFTALELLAKFRKIKDDMAIALDEQGGVAGIVTMDDILRAVFGRMTDESSKNEIAPENRIKIISGKEFLVPGDMKLSDVNEVLKLKLESEEYNTLGGWLLEHFDALPSIGEALRDGNTLFVIEDQSRRRIESVRIKIGSP